MANKSDWQEANRRLAAEQRQTMGDPPTAEELLAYSRGEVSESEEERIRNLLVAYPELARMYGAPLAGEPEPGVSDEEIAGGLHEVKRRLGINTTPRRSVWYYLPTTIAAALALVFFGLYVQAESRAHDGNFPRVLGAAQELDPDGNRGPSAATVLRKDGEAYLVKLRLIHPMRSPHYRIELNEKEQTLWTSESAELAQDDSFQIVIPHGFLRAGPTYQLRIFGVDGETRRQAGSYDVAVAGE